MPDFTADLQSADALGSSPMSGVRVGVIQQTMGEGVAAGVTAAVNGALQHMQQLGATVEEVRGHVACDLVINLVNCLQQVLCAHAD